MEVPPKVETTKENIFEVLSNKLSAHEIEPDKFLDEILALDQSNPERTSAIGATELMTRPDILALFEGLEERTKFYSIRSLSFFHKAQIRLREGHTDVEDDLQMALHDSLEVGFHDKDWTDYIRSTIAYLKGDLAQLKDLEKQLDLNKSLVKNFIQGLEERGYPDYFADYSKVRNE